ncbi:trypsin-like peptidase domain-containing protein [Donghicola eburneus]|uniref:trypsin-like peptidase domain-containing protein n=1 Tax=Donghicola eburneus TaxID=393278 RepID=UPI0008F32BA2|nr:trypsin-like peptidase domain-containing protein [Donghicola eburneus]SFQ66427.1 TPR repeat [Donghicola eburneus]
MMKRPIEFFLSVILSFILTISAEPSHAESSAAALNKCEGSQKYSELMPGGTQSLLNYTPAPKYGSMEELREYGEAATYRAIGKNVGMLRICREDGNVDACTAILLNERLILTNAHCFQANENGHAAIGMNLFLEFLNPGEWENRPKYGVKFPPKEIGDKNGLDYAIFELEKPVKNIEKLSVEIRDPGKGESMFILGHPNGDVMRLSRMKCKSDRQRPIAAGNLVQHTCETLPGSSGSPGFAERDGKLITLHARGVGDSGSRVNIGILMSALVKESAILQEVFARPENEAQGAQTSKSQDPCEAIGLDDGLDLVCRVVDGKVQIGMPPARDLTAKNGASVIPLTECDRLAGSMFAKRSGEIEGLFLEDIDGPAAIQACEAAIKEYPQEPHFHIYLARALNAVDDQHPRIWSELELGKAANTQYVTTYQAELLVDGEAGQEKDVEKRISLLGELCDTGYAIACNSLGILYAEGEATGAEDEATAVTYYQRACDGGNMYGCSNLAWRYKNGEGGLSVDLAKAAELFAQACEGGDADDCDSLGTMYAEGEVSGEEDETSAVTYYQRACDGGEMYGCKNLAWRYKNGKGGLSVDLAKAADLYGQACEGGNANACNSLGIMHAEGEVTGEEDESSAVTYYQRACDGGDMWGCSNLAWRYENGKGGLSIDLAKAADLYGQACQGGNAGACNSLGVMYAEGEVTGEEDRATAVTYYHRACEGGNMTGCKNLAWHYQNGKGGLSVDLVKAADLYGQACEGGKAGACNSLGAMYSEGEVAGEEDEATAVTYYERACDGGEMWGCTNLAGRYKNGEGGLSVDLAKAADLYGQACEGGKAVACNSLGAMYSEGEVAGEEDEATAVTYYQRACDGGNIYGCRNLAWRYRNGEGGLSVDLAKAADLLQKGCDADHAESCENLADLYEDGEVTGQEDLKRSSNLFIRACDLENSRCNRVGWRYEHGAGGFEVNLGKAAEFYGRACEEGAAESCFSLGLIFARGGEGLPVDEQKAETLLQSACESQYGEACRQLGYNHADETEKALIFFKKACEFEDSVGCAAYAEWVLFQNPAERREFMERGCNLERNADLAGFACAGLVALELEEENYLKAASISMEHFKAGSSGIYDQNYVHSRPPNSTLFHPDFTGYLQQALKAEGYYSGKIDGDFGPKTMSAIEALCECKVAVFH